MTDASSSPRRSARFGPFDIDLRSGELRKSGTRVNLPDQPFRLLAVLLERPGELVTRDELRARLWPADTFVDFEHGLNAAVKRLRDALGDSAEHPRYIETVPRRGYRFVPPIDGTVIASASAPAIEEQAGATGSSRRKRRLLMPLAVAGALAGAVAWSWWSAATRVVPARELPGQLTRLTFDPGLQTDPTFSPDGELIAYASNRTGNFDIWMQPVTGGAAVQLTTDPADDTQPDWSPDGRSIVFRSEREGGGIFTVSPADRHVERLAPIGYLPRWSPDGSKLAFAGSRGGPQQRYYTAAADGTNLAAIALPPIEEHGFTIAAGWHPSGRLVFLHGSGALLGLTALDPGASRLTPRRVAPAVRDRFVTLSLMVEHAQPLAATAGGRTLYFVADANGVKDIWRVTLDPASLEIVDGPERVTTGAEWTLMPAVSRGGARLAFSTSTQSVRVWVCALDGGRRIGSPPRVMTPPELDATQPALSPDGRSLVFIGQRRGAPREKRLMLTSLEDPASVITLRVFDREVPENVWRPLWSPDGTKVAYSYRRGISERPPTFSSSVRWVDVRSRQDTAITSTWVSRSAAVENPWGWSADGQWLFTSGDRYSTDSLGLVRLPVSGAPNAERMARPLFSSSTHALWNASESPDGRWVCANRTTLTDADSSALHVLPAQGGEPRPLLDDHSWDDKPRWSADGRIIYFLSRRGGTFDVWGVQFDPLRGRAAGAPFQITDLHTPDRQIAGLDRDCEISVVGDRLALPLLTLSGGIWMLH